MSSKSVGTPVSSPQVDLGYARYQGTTTSSGVNQYLGMRFAAAPVGDLRFRAPIPPPVTLDVQDATAFQPVGLGIVSKPTGITESEDCLFLNVWSPANATPESKLPVWVYIQGGGYNANSNANYNGSGVVTESKNSIIFVNLNYRVGCWGFLASEEVRKNGDFNVGLLDQRMALQWVQQHISKFGGNPEHVVVHGVSAGAGSVALHLAAFGGRDDKLFIGAILESPFLPTHPPPSELEWQFNDFIKATDCANSDDPLCALRSKDTAILQAENRATPYPGQSGPPRFPWTPTIDGDLIQDYPYRMFENGKFIKVPIMIGNDTNEGSGFAPDASSYAEMIEFFLNNYPNLSKADIEAIVAHYPVASSIPMHASHFPSASAAYGDSTFTSPGNTLSSLIAAQIGSDKVWSYRYNVQDQRLIDMGLGVPHTFETPAIFGPEFCKENPESSYKTYNKDIVPVVMNYWISFIKSLDPNVHKHNSAPVWQSWGNGSGQRLAIETNKTRMEDIPQAEIEKAVFWKGLGDAMRH